LFVVGVSYLLLSVAGSAWGQADSPKADAEASSASGSAESGSADKGGRKSPPKLTDAQQKVASVTVNAEAVKGHLIERPALALLGKDAVALVDSSTEVDGKSDIAVRFDGQNYLFSSVENKTRFEQSPGRYVPALSGYSVVSWKNNNRLAAGSLAFRSVSGDRLYLFANEDEKKAFEANPQAFENVDLGLQGFSSVVLVEEEVLRRGDKKVEVIYEGRRFHFASASDRDVFASNPGRYYPTLGGLDVVQLAQGKPAMGEAKFSAVYKNRLYCFASAETRDQFIAQADALSDFDVARSGVDQVARVEGAGDQVGHYGISTIHRGLRYLFVDEKHRERFQGDPENFLTAASGSAPPANSTQEKSSPSPPAANPPEAAETKKAEKPQATDADPNVEEPAPVK
jgi:YHS domain-containing protein